MAARSATGVWEKEPGSGVWWTRYRVNGKLKRERVGRKEDAISLYAIRKSNLICGAKMPANLREHEQVRVRVIRSAYWRRLSGEACSRT